DEPNKHYASAHPLTKNMGAGHYSHNTGSVLTGSLTRAAGEGVGSYAISQGSLAANANYTISFTGRTLSITPATLVVTADAQTKVYGASDPTLTYKLSGLQLNDNSSDVLTG